MKKYNVIIHLQDILSPSDDEEDLKEAVKEALQEAIDADDEGDDSLDFTAEEADDEEGW